MAWVVYLVVFFFVAAAADWLSLRWHGARDRGRTWATVHYGVWLEAINWAPIVFAIESDSISAAWIAVASVGGTVLGTWAGMRTRVKSQGASPPSGHVLKTPIAPVVAEHGPHLGGDAPRKAKLGFQVPGAGQQEK